MTPTMNTLVGLPFLFTIPAYVLWGALSAYVWRLNDPSVRFSNYRLAATAVLATTALLIMDLSRLRFHVTVFGAPPNPTTWLTLIVRWLWGLSILWGTVVIYGAYIPLLWIRIRGGRAGPHGADPYLDLEHGDAEMPSPHEPDRIEEQRSLLRQVRAELNAIIARIDADESQILPDAGPKGNGKR